MAENNSTVPDFSALANKSYFRKAIESEGFIKTNTSTLNKVMGTDTQAFFLSDPREYRFGLFLKSINKVTPASYERIKKVAPNFLSKEVIQKVLPESADVFNGTKIIESLMQKVDKKELKTFRNQSRNAFKWSEYSGFGPVGFAHDAYDVKSSLNHEIIHQTHHHDLSSGSKFFDNLYKGESLSMEKAIGDKIERDFPKIKARYPNAEKETVKSATIASYKSSVAKVARSDPKHADYVEKSEAIAHTFQDDHQFVSQIESLGVKTARNETAKLKSLIEKTMASGSTKSPVGWTSMLASGARKMAGGL